MLEHIISNYRKDHKDDMVMLVSFNTFIDKFDDENNDAIVTLMYRELDLNIIKLLMISKTDLFDQKFILTLLGVIKTNEEELIDYNIAVKILKSFKTMYSLEVITSN